MSVLLHFRYESFSRLLGMIIVIFGAKNRESSLYRVIPSWVLLPLGMEKRSAVSSVYTAKYTANIIKNGRRLAVFFV